MFWCIIGIITCLKVLLIPSYHSTDFEVHRNWLAITHSLPISKWYYEDSSEWTLDYPPLFAWFEFILSHFAKYFDPNMLKIDNLNYQSDKTVLFQRATVILCDLVLAYGIKDFCSYLSTSGLRKSSKWSSKWQSPSAILQVLLFGNIGLIMVDHIHFQYNGFLFGILLISVTKLFKGKSIQSAFFFSILLNLKHIFIYIAPPYFIYLLRNYCFSNMNPNLFAMVTSFSKKKFFKLSFTVILIFSISFGPFLALKQMDQVLSRLFPFKRGLCHSYWAPNFWAMYNTLDKFLEVTLRKLGFKIESSGSMTKGLVQDIYHSVLPNITPRITFILTTLSMAPCLIKLWLCPGNALHFIRCIVICGLSSFLFGWHVHEKAILIPIIALTLVAVIWQKEAQIFLILSITGHYSLHPLLFKPFELPIKFLLFLLHCLYAFTNFSFLFDEYRKHSVKLPLLTLIESLYVLGFFPLFIFDVVIIPILGVDEKLPFLNLLITSLYCSFGIGYSWLKYYFHFLSMSDTTHKRKIR